MLEKNTIVPKQGISLIEGLSQNIALHFVLISYLEEYFIEYLLFREALVHIHRGRERKKKREREKKREIENCSEFQFGHMLKVS